MNKRFISIIFCFILIITMCSCDKDKQEVSGASSIATLDGESIDEAYFKYYFTEYKKSLQSQYGETTWQNATLEGKPALDFVREKALQNAVEDKMITDVAKAEKIQLTGEDKNQMSAIKKQWISSYGNEKNFTERIKNDYGLSMEQFDYMLESVYYRNHLSKKYISDESVHGYYNEKVIKVKHILIPTVVLGSNVPLTEDEVEQAKSTVVEIQQKIENGEDFDSLVAKYTKDSDTFYYVGNGYSLGADGSYAAGMTEEFEAECFKLNIGDISDVVESPYGYHIIKRYENDEAMYQIAKDTMASVLFTDVLEEWKAQKKLVINNEIYNKYN